MLGWDCYCHMCGADLLCVHNNPKVSLHEPATPIIEHKADISFTSPRFLLYAPWIFNWILAISDFKSPVFKVITIVSTLLQVGMETIENCIDEKSKRSVGSGKRQNWGNRSLSVPWPYTTNLYFLYCKLQYLLRWLSIMEHRSYMIISSNLYCTLYRFCSAAYVSLIL